MKTVREMLNKKGNITWVISQNATVLEALQLMSEKDIGALLVVEDEALVGIISERDYARKVVLLGKSSKDAFVKEIMTPHVLCVTLGTTTEECMAVMTSKKIRHLPVYENGKLDGVISIGDVVNALIDEQEFVIDQLVNYITSTPQINKK